MKMISICDDFFIDKEDKNIETHRVLSQYSDNKGVNYECEKYFSQALSTKDLPLLRGIFIERKKL